MLTSSTAERRTLCADYEIGLRLGPQVIHPSARNESRRTRHPDHTGFGQTWSVTKGAMNNIDYSTVQIAPAEASLDPWQGRGFLRHPTMCYEVGRNVRRQTE